MAYRVVRFPQVGSTNDIVLDAAEAGTGPGLVVVAGLQRAGKGRSARDWASPEGGLWATALLDWRMPFTMGGLVPLSVASACARALVRSGVDARVRWPNDLMLEDRKLGGILVESRSQGDRFAAIAAGIGINVGNDPPFPDAGACKTVAPLLAAPQLLDAILVELEPMEGLLKRGDAKRLCEQFMHRAWGIDRKMLLDGRPVTPKEIAVDGALIVESENGEVELARTGSLRLEPRTSSSKAP